MPEGIRAKKEENFSEWYTEVIQKAELADIRFGIQGFIVHKPWGFFIIKKIYEALEAEVETQGHQAFLFPTAVKEENLMKEKEHAGFTPEVLWVTEAGDKKLEEKFALRPTGEAQIYPIYALWLRSYRDLPYRGYQSRISVFRNEMTTRPFLRGREFLFFETHDAFNTHEEALEQIQLDLDTCKKIIHGKFKIPFFYFKRPEWDKFKGADNTFTPDTLMPDGKRNQLASTHDLGQNFSKAYEIKIKGKDEKEFFAYQTCFGPGIWRIMAALIGIHGDDKGLILPFDMAPIQIVIVPIVPKEEFRNNIMRVCKILEENVKTLGYRAKIDDSEDTPGSKYNKWEMMGVPIRFEVGPKEVENKSIAIALRGIKEKKIVSATDINKELKIKIEELDKALQDRADSYLNDKVRESETLKDLIQIMKKHRGFIRIPFCSVDKDGEKCEEKLKAETQGARVCGTLYPIPEKVKHEQKCVVCNKEAKHIVYIAKSY